MLLVILRRPLALAFALLLIRGAVAKPPVDPPPNANATIRAPAGPSDIIITTTDRLAGAIHSLTWNGKEFIDSLDHGRQLQSACSFDCALPGPFWAECYNPTEAGSRDDSAGPRSTSRLLSLRAEDAELETKTQMAFWLAPGERSEGRPALNTAVLSDHVLTKRVRIGYKNLAHVIEYTATFTVPEGERHTFAQFEALTGYMPIEFSRMRTFDAATGALADIDFGPGEQDRPLVFAADDGAHAMGIFSPDPPSPGFERQRYGRFRFEKERVVKWNCVFRIRNEASIAPGDYAYRMFVAVGTLEDVRQALIALAAAREGEAAGRAGEAPAEPLR